jgi:hypothetical protein
MLSKAGVSPRVAQAAMRHSSIDLTMNVYTDPRLLDVQGAVESLPEFTVTNDPNENRHASRLGPRTSPLTSRIWLHHWLHQSLTLRAFRSQRLSPMG